MQVVLYLLKKPVGNFDFSGGIRYDTRIEHVKDLYTNAQGEKLPGPETGSVQRFSAFDTTFSGISGSLGATWQISKVFLRNSIFQEDTDPQTLPSWAPMACMREHSGTNWEIRI